MAAAWAVLACASLGVRESGHGVLLLWLPSAVAVAALAQRRRDEWPPFLIALFCANFAASLLFGIPLGRSAGFATAQLAEAVVCVSIGRRVLGRHDVPQTMRHLTGIFFAALAASAASTLLALPFRLHGGLGQQVWWFLATTLGMLVGTPIIVYVRQLLHGGEQRTQTLQRNPPANVIVVFVSAVVLSALVLTGNSFATIPLLFCGLVFGVLKSGQMGAAASVLGFAATATVGERLGFVQAETFGLSPFLAGLALQAYMLLMLATSLPLASALISRQRLERTLRRRNDDLRANMTILKLAETLAGMGRWRLDCRTGEQNWSEQMLALNGLPPGYAPDPGDIRELLPDGGTELFGLIAARRESRIPYSFDYRIQPPVGHEKILRMNAFNEFSGDRRSAIFAVAMDVTDQRIRERSLDRERADALRLATEAQRLANTDVLTGMANRRCALATLDKMLLQARREGTPLSLVMFDIDHFKQVNDRHGHGVGDEVLVRVARIAQAMVRADDLVGRLGGEEFVWLLPGIAEAGAARLAERLRQAIAGNTGRSGLPPVTVSVGLACRRSDESASDLLVRADKALYFAKDDGRNRVRKAA
ncbi:diguanylate cyclase [Tsuneonella sp. HG222]